MGTARTWPLTANKNCPVADTDLTTRVCAFRQVIWPHRCLEFWPHGAPFAEGQVGGDRDGGAFFAFGDDLEEQFCSARVDLDVAEFDEVGYIPFEQDAANLFLQLVSSRYEHASLILTSNLLPFARWGDVFGDQVVAAAMIDRIVHHADVIALKGASYRIKHTTIETLPSVWADLQADSTP